MESHILNSYHQARYRTIGHKVLRTSESLSSEGSCTQTSPEYPNQQKFKDDRQYWRRNGQEWTRHQTINMTRNHDSSSDEDENIEVQEVSFDDDASVQNEPNSDDNVEDTSLVEGDDYDVIQVYAVDPNMDYEASSDEEQEDFCMKDKESSDVLEEVVYNHKHESETQEFTSDVLFTLDTPVVSNVDEYFVKEEKHIDKDILAVKDDPVVNDVDEYFIKEQKPLVEKIHDVDEYFIKEQKPLVEKINDVDEYFIKEQKPVVEKIPRAISDIEIDNKLPETCQVDVEELPETSQVDVEELPVTSQVDVEELPETSQVDVEELPVTSQVDVEELPETSQVDVEELPETSQVDVEEFFAKNTPNVPKIVAQPEPGHAEEPIITESDFIPKIEAIKRFLLDDYYPRSNKSAQRSCSLPQSPMHNILDDAKTCLSFEDLNIDLSDLTFESDKDKSFTSNKSDDPPRTLTEEDVNSFLITPIKAENNKKVEDDLTQQDMEIERPVESIIVPVAPIETPPIAPPHRSWHTPETKPNVLGFCIEKSSAKKVNSAKGIKVEAEDFVDVESCNETIIPVLEANNLNSLLEQFEATEKLNKKNKKAVIPVTIKTEEPVKSVSLTNGMRLQDAGVQLNKTKMRQILMPSTINATVRRSPSPVHSDHDYCTSKKRQSLPNIKKGQSLLKPEVLSSNNRILSSRHRSCKSKKVVYQESDDESEKCNKNKKQNPIVEVLDAKVKKSNVIKTIKALPNPTRKKLSPPHTVSDTFKDKSNCSVIVDDASKASDTPCSQNSNSSIKLTIKNKSEVILNCDLKDSQKVKTIEKCKSSSKSNEKSVIKVEVKNKDKTVKCKADSNSKSVTVNSVDETVNIKEETRPKVESLYTGMFVNKQDVQMPQNVTVKSEKRSFEEEISLLTTISNKETEQPTKKKKLNLQEYKLRRGVSSNNSSAAVSPESIFPDLPKTVKITPDQTPPNGRNTTEQTNPQVPMKIFDPIREASRKILMYTKKQKAEAMRKRDEDIVMSKIPKVQNLKLQPLISDAEMMKIVGMSSNEVVPAPVIEKPQAPAEYEEISMVSVGVNTDEEVFKQIKKSSEKAKKAQPPDDPKSTINFKIKKADNVLKQNVFETVKRDKKSPVDEKKNSETKIDKERFKGITATLKSVEKQVDTKICSNSLFASIQDVVKKKAPEENEKPKRDEKILKTPKRVTKPIKVTIVREYDIEAEHGEDKVILYLGKDRDKPQAANNMVQTDPDPKFSQLQPIEIDKLTKRKRTDSDMSMSSECSPVREKNVKRTVPVVAKLEKREVKRQSNEKRRSIDRHNRSRSKDIRERSRSKSRRDRSRSKDRRERSRSKDRRERSRSKDRRDRSRSKDRHDRSDKRRSRSRSRSRRRRRSLSRSKSRSRSSYRRYRRSDSPYRRKRRSRSYKKRSPSRSYRKKSRSRRDSTRSKSPVKKATPPRVAQSPKSMTPPLRKPTVSESSDSSTSSSSCSSSSSSSSDRSSRRSLSPYIREDYKKTSAYCSEDRDNTPVEERRIVFVGRLEQDITKPALRSQFTKFGPVIEVRLHSKEDGSRYGFVTFQRARDAWTAVESANTFPQYDVGFGGRRAFCRQTYADLDGLEATYTESAFHGQPSLPTRREDMSFEQMLLEVKKKLSQRKVDMKEDEKP